MNPSAPIYLDNNSTTLIHPEVAEAMLRASRDLVGNPASQHSLGRKVRRVLEEAREGIVSLLGGKTGGMEADRLIFTSGGTEANQLAIRGLGEGRAGENPTNSNIVVSSIEHPSVLGAADAFAASGVEFRRLPATESGVVAAGDLSKLLDSRTRLVSVMLANNETGVLQPVAQIAAECGSRNIPLHTDAVQAVGKIPVNFRGLGVAAMTVSPHKIHGPLGIGGLLLKHGANLQPLFHGGFQQAGLRPGTESAPLAVGFFTALTFASRDLDERQKRMAMLREKLESLLLAGTPNCVIVGKGSPRLPTTTCVAFPGVNRQALVMAIDMAGVACSTGSACASGSSEPSRALVAMGLPQEQVESAIRLSVSALTTDEEIVEGARRILKCVNHLRRQ